MRRSETLPTIGYGALLGSPQGASLDSRQLLWWTGLTQLPLWVSRVGVLDMYEGQAAKIPSPHTIVTKIPSHHILCTQICSPAISLGQKW
jgi:hypothetical protein